MKYKNYLEEHSDNCLSILEHIEETICHIKFEVIMENEIIYYLDGIKRYYRIEIKYLDTYITFMSIRINAKNIPEIEYNDDEWEYFDEISFWRLLTLKLLGV